MWSIRSARHRNYLVHSRDPKLPTSVIFGSKAQLRHDAQQCGLDLTQRLRDSFQAALAVQENEDGLRKKTVRPIARQDRLCRRGACVAICAANTTRPCKEASVQVARAISDCSEDNVAKLRDSRP